MGDRCAAYTERSTAGARGVRLHHACKGRPITTRTLREPGGASREDHEWEAQLCAVHAGMVDAGGWPRTRRQG